MTSLVWVDIWEKPTRRSHSEKLVRSELRVGLLALPVAELRISSGGSHYWAYCDLPLTLSLKCDHGPLDEMKETISQQVEVWFQVANHDEPSLEDGAGI